MLLNIDPDLGYLHERSLSAVCLMCIIEEDGDYNLSHAFLLRSTVGEIDAVCGKALADVTRARKASGKGQFLFGRTHYDSAPAAIRAMLERMSGAIALGEGRNLANLLGIAEGGEVRAAKDRLIHESTSDILAAAVERRQNGDRPVLVEAGGPVAEYKPETEAICPAPKKGKPRLPGKKLREDILAVLPEYGGCMTVKEIHEAVGGDLNYLRCRLHDMALLGVIAKSPGRKGFCKRKTPT